MKGLLLLAMILSLPAAAQVSLDDLCGGAPKAGAMKLQTIGTEQMLIMDNGFCAEYLKQKEEEKTAQSVESLSKPILLNVEICEGSQIHQPMSNPLVKTNTDKWKLRFYASHSFTSYLPSDLTIQSSRYNVEIKDYKWAERGSREFFTASTLTEPGNNVLQFIDEPTNTFVLSLEKNGHEFFLSAFHPKFLQESGQVADMTGTIDGNPVIPNQPINTQFYGYTHTPGESKLVRNQNTHQQMTFELGYGHRFNLIDSKFGKISYIPSIGLGVMVGANLTVVVQEGQWWDFDKNLDKLGVQGFGGSITNRLEFNTPKEKFGVFYENKIGHYKQEHGFLDGTQKYNLTFIGNSVGMKFMINNPNNKKKKIPGAF
jgi:hypothetical protein